MITSDHIRLHPFSAHFWNHGASVFGITAHRSRWCEDFWPEERNIFWALHVPYKPVNLRMLHQYIIYLLPGRCFMRVAAQDMLLWAHVILHAVLGKLFIVINWVPKKTLAQWKLSWFTISSPRTFQKKLRWGIGMIESALLSCSKSNILKCKASMVLCTNWNGQLQPLRFSWDNWIIMATAIIWDRATIFGIKSFMGNSSKAFGYQRLAVDLLGMEGEHSVNVVGTYWGLLTIE